MLTTVRNAKICSDKCQCTPQLLQRENTFFCIIPPPGGQVRDLASPRNGHRAGQFPAQSYLPFLLKVLVAIRLGNQVKIKRLLLTWGPDLLGSDPTGQACALLIQNIIIFQKCFILFFPLPTPENNNFLQKWNHLQKGTFCEKYHISILKNIYHGLQLSKCPVLTFENENKRNFERSLSKQNAYQFLSELLTRFLPKGSFLLLFSLGFSLLLISQIVSTGTSVRQRHI